MLLTTACGLLQPHARLVAAHPAAGTTLASTPPVVALEFSDTLGPASTLSVSQTVVLDSSGQAEATGGTLVARVTGPTAIAAGGRALHVALPTGLPRGLFSVDWTTTAARGGAERFGALYFAVGMAVPEHIVRDGVSRESETHHAENTPAEALLGGMLVILVGVALPWLATCPVASR